MAENPIDSKGAGLANEKLILTLLRQHAQLSQAQICELANLSSSTTSYIVARLREKDLIIETQGESTKRGAKPVFVSINSTGQFTVGVEINPSSLFIGLFDFNCQLVEKIRVLLDTDRSPENISSKLEINLRGVLSKHNIEYGKVSGIGVALSGSISKDGVVELSSPLSWKAVPLKDMLTAKLNIPVAVCTTRVRLLAESSIANNIDYSNVLYLNIADGVGSHAIIDGNLLHGSTNRAGEIGHIIAIPDGPKCGCGHKGCLEALISGPALAKKILQDIKHGQKTTLKDVVNSEDLPEVIISKWGQAIQQKDEYSMKLCAFIAEHFSKIAASTINCYDPNIVILAGYVTKQCFDYLETAIRETMATDVYDNTSRNIQIKQASLGTEALIIGAAKTAFQQYSA
jgi:predicted NBD/HSP70 family sugar kinase